jgi:hypothetical protein
MGWKRQVLRSAADIGYGRELLDLYESLSDAVGHEVNPNVKTMDPDVVDPRIREFELGDDVKGEVLLPITQGGSTNANTYIYGVLAHAFRTREYRPITVLCDADLDLCFRKTPDNDDGTVCAMCHRAGDHVLDAFGLEPLVLSDLLDSRSYPDPWSLEDIENVVRHDVDVASFARANTYRFLKKYRIDLTDEYERSVYLRFLDSALRIAEAADRIYEEHDIDATLGLMSAYVYGGIYLAMAEDRGIDARTFRKGYIDRTLCIGDTRNDAANALYADSDVVERELSKPLSEAQTGLLEEIMEGRVSGEMARQHQIQGASGTIDHDDDGELLVGLFPNVPWDAALDLYHVTFDSPFEWLEATVAHLGGRDGVGMVLKPHPGEIRAVENRWGRVSTWVEEELHPLPDNVRVLAPETDVSPYELMEEIDVGVVYMSTVGMEMAYRGIPTVMVGNTHYRGQGFTFDPDTPEEYAGLLDSLDELRMDGSMREAARRYLYLLFVQRHLAFPYYQTEDVFGRHTQPLPVTHEEVLESEALETIVDGVIEGRPVLESRDQTEILRDTVFRL